MKRIRLCAIFIISLVFSNYIFASYNKEISKELFENANTFYKNGDIENAFSIYKKLAIEDKVSSKDLYYNLATCYEIMGEKGNAVLWYERLLLIDPFDKEVYSRLTLMIDGYNNNIKVIYIILHIFLYSFLFAITASSLLLIFSFVSIKYRGALKKLLYISLIVSLIMLSFTAISQIMYNKSYIVVIKDNVSLYKGNSLQSDSLKVLNEGSRLKILEEYNYWWYVEMGSGEKGWIYKEHSQKI